MPKPGTNSLPLGVSGAFTVADVVVVLVTGLSADVVPATSLFTVATEVLTVSVVVVNAVMSCTITGSGGTTGARVTWFTTLFGFSGLIGLTGLATLFTLSTVILQVLDIVDHAVHVGEPYGSEHIELLCSINNPSKPLAHATCLVSVDSIHVGGSCVQLLEVVDQADQVCVEQS